MPDQEGNGSSHDQKPQLRKSNSEQKLQNRTKGSRGKDGEGHAAAARRQFAHIKPRLSREEIIAQFKRQSSKDSTTQMMSEDHFDKAQEAQGMVRGETAVVYDECMVEHKCLWDLNYPELPERFTSVINRCQEMNLLEKCLRIPSRPASAEEVLTKHKLSYYGLLRSTSGETDVTKLEALSQKYDSIYFHPKTYELALLAAGCTIDLVDHIVAGKTQNGMAIIRPPGHHAMEAEACGYSFLNNVALAAEHALQTYQRILIVDWDVHHGQGTQRMFYDDDRVLYFSMHRYEYGSYWPNLRESDFDHVGEGKGQGFNFNIPLNSTGMKNEDFMAIFHQILMPVAYEFCPELVIVSAGYDSALGDEKGEMLLTPAIYAHFTSHLMTLAQGKVAVILEGGYCLESLAEGAALTLRALLGNSNPYLIEYLGKPSQSIKETILNVIYKQREFWKCFKFQGVISEKDDRSNKQSHRPVTKFLGSHIKPETFETRDCYPVQDVQTKEKFNLYLNFIKAKTNLSQSKTKLGLVYDPLMNKHYNTNETTHPERPERITEIWAKLKEFGILDRSLLVKSSSADVDDLNLVHSQDHIDFLGTLHTKTSDELDDLREKLHSVYFNTESNTAALLSAGSLVRLVDYVCQGVCQRGLAVIRPPGHHAEQSEAQGFCLYNNVAVAAQHVKHIHGASRILILDWDVHHGNGTQHAFEDDPQVLYISIHRYDDGSFFPSTEDGNYDKVGKGKGVGYNVNIPWAKGGMGDAEYMTAMTQVVLPIAYQFNPQLVIVSAGFDAAIGDPLGRCKVSPECFGHMTSLLKGLAGGKIVLALEGGYNLGSISYCMTMCAKALLDDPLPSLQPLTTVHPTAIEAINLVISEHSKYWSSLCFQVDLPLSNGDDICLDTLGDDQSKKEENVQIVNYCFVPTIKREDIYSNVIQDRIDGKIVKYRQGSEVFIRHCFCTQCPLPAHLQLHQDCESIRAAISALPQWGRPAKKEFLFEPMSKRSPKKAFSEPSKKHSIETRHNGTRSHPNTPVRSSGRRNNMNRGLFDSAMKTAVKSKEVVRGGTGLLLEQTCLSHQGCPNSTANKQLTSYSSILNRIKDLHILEECIMIEGRKASEKEVSKEVQRFEYLKNISDILNLNKNGTVSNNHIMCNMDTAMLAAGSTMEIVEAVVQGKVQNGLAMVCPPNHHVHSQKTPQFCFFNNVAVAANYALEELDLNRILVFNWGPQHDQASQYVFYNNPKVLTFSIHEYKHGSQWPFLREGDFDHIGVEHGQGFNFNVPINKSEIEDQDMLAIFHQLLLPVAYEFNPELVIVSGGFDFPDLSPLMYAHMTHLLMSAARGKVVVVLQGSYTLDVVPQFTDTVLGVLLGRSCPAFPTSFEKPSQEVRDTILNCIYVQRSYWKCFKFQGTFLSAYPSSVSTREMYLPKMVFKGPTGVHALPSPHSTPKTLSQINKSVTSQLKPRVSLVYDVNMMKHKNISEPGHPEKPQRIQNIYQRLLEFELVDRCKVLQSRKAKKEELELVHSKSHVKLMSELRSMKPRELHQMQYNYNSIYFHPDTNQAALLAAGSILQAVDSACGGDCPRGVAVIRPPGHHAEERGACGFCIYNNVAVAAKYALEMHNLTRVMILDWDVHHGNGIQHMFESDPRVLYVSIHRYDNATFFPCSTDANFDQVGEGEGRGYNVNIPWCKGSMGDAEYMAAMMQVVLPIGYQFNPQLVFVSAGFDAAVGDPLGGCCVTPACYGHITHLLTSLADGRVIVALEGGYNLTSISYSMTMVGKALLGDPLPPLDSGEPCKEAISDINSVITAHSKFWSQLSFQVDLPMDNVLNKMEESLLSVTSSPDSFYTPPTSPYKGAPIDKNSIDELVTAVKGMEIKEERKGDEVEEVMEIELESKNDKLEEAVDIKDENKSKELHKATQLAEGLIQEVLHEASVAVAQAEVTARIVVQAAVRRGIGKVAQGMEAGEHEGAAGMTTVLDDVICGDLDELAHAWLVEMQALVCKASDDMDTQEQTTGVVGPGAGSGKSSCNAATELQQKEASPVDAVAVCCGGGSDNPGPSSSGGSNSGGGASGGGSGEDLEALGAVGGSDPNNVNTFLLTELEGAQNMFAVVPLSWCPHLETAVQPVPSSGINTRLPCEECQDPSENWICLTCYKVLCGRYVQEHMLLHAVTHEHYLTLSFSDLSVWCYACDSYVHHERLYAAKRAAHLDKFGEDVPSAWQ
ncbi:histone deacetylase 6 isoform X2 [Oratosquilla oratoria]|uniref:histone deacetylase 6 isoform X2 n=1 Tax=Oratosquilla oratoria TaxID=337810 RepID=UPI003F76686F